MNYYHCPFPYSDEVVCFRPVRSIFRVKIYEATFSQFTYAAVINVKSNANCKRLPRLEAWDGTLTQV